MIIRSANEEDSHSDLPKTASRAFWPSTHAYSKAMYAAGMQEGSAAERYLIRVQDREQRVLAQIELAAALNGLPHRQVVQRGGNASLTFERIP